MPVGAERYTRHRGGVAGERIADRLAGVGVPQLHRAVGVAEASRCPSGLNATRPGVEGERIADRLAGVGVPELHRAVGVRRRLAGARRG